MATKKLNQHEERAKAILAKRGGKKYEEPATLFTGPTPTEQAEEMAKKVLLRRGEEAPEKVNKVLEADFDEDDEFEDAENPDGPGVNDVAGDGSGVNTPLDDDMDDAVDAPLIPDALDGMTKKQLKVECDKLGIEYPKKVTNDALIELLKGA